MPNNKINSTTSTSCIKVYPDFQGKSETLAFGPPTPCYTPNSPNTPPNTPNTSYASVKFYFPSSSSSSSSEIDSNEGIGRAAYRRHTI